MKKKPFSWKTNFLLPVGQLTLTTSTLNAIPTYAMQYFDIPATTSKLIDKIQRNFLWGTTSLDKKNSLYRLGKISFPQGEWRLRTPNNPSKK